MKRSVLATVISVVLLGYAFSSCSKEGYSLDNFLVTCATAVAIDPQNYYLQTDGGDKLWVAASNVYSRPLDGERLIIDVTLLSDEMDGYDHYVRLNSYSSIKTKPVVELTEQNSDSIGHDKIQVLDLWYAGNHMNVVFGINMGGERVHFVNLVSNPTTPYPKDGKVHLELRHNANGDKETFSRKFIVNFDVRKFIVDNNPVTFVIHADTYKEGAKSYEVTVNPANPTQSEVNIAKEEVYVVSKEWQ